MLKIAAVAFLPTASVTFGILVILILSFPSATSDFGRGASLIYGAAAFSSAISVPIAWFVAYRMLARRERRLVDGGAAAGKSTPISPPR